MFYLILCVTSGLEPDWELPPTTLPQRRHGRPVTVLACVPLNKGSGSDVFPVETEKQDNLPNTTTAAADRAVPPNRKRVEDSKKGRRGCLFLPAMNTEPPPQLLSAVKTQRVPRGVTSPGTGWLGLCQHPEESTEVAP